MEQKNYIPSIVLLYTIPNEINQNDFKTKILDCINKYEIKIIFYEYNNRLFNDTMKNIVKNIPLLPEIHTEPIKNLIISNLLSILKESDNLESCILKFNFLLYQINYLTNLIYLPSTDTISIEYITDIKSIFKFIELLKIKCKEITINNFKNEIYRIMKGLNLKLTNIIHVNQIFDNFNKYRIYDSFYSIIYYILIMYEYDYAVYLSNNSINDNKTKEFLNVYFI